jgi:hypothetical protein
MSAVDLDKKRLNEPRHLAANSGLAGALPHTLFFRQVTSFFLTRFYSMHRLAKGN